MITALGHADLTPDAWELVREDLRARLKGLPTDVAGLVRAGAGLPLEFGRMVCEAGRSLVVCLPERSEALGGASPRDRDAQRELLALAEGMRMLPFDPLDRDACVSADEQLVRGCDRLLAVWDGSPSCGHDATAHMVAYARAHGVPVEVVWPEGAARRPSDRALRLSTRGRGR
ncbi:hypothetical protein ACIPQA_25775 [Streptomyces sp. NPDC090109]|uniref:hypothetical protein n=1 Tax=unclassified Streptomyces TaxID=2593676 RepID=UPI000EF7ADA7|nr:hypothetical protein [Streptomyces sp. S1]